MSRHSLAHHAECQDILAVLFLCIALTDFLKECPPIIHQCTSVWDYCRGNLSLLTRILTVVANYSHLSTRKKITVLFVYQKTAARGWYFHQATPHLDMTIGQTLSDKTVMIVVN